MIKFHLLSMTFRVQMSACCPGCVYTFPRLPSNVVCQLQSHSDLKMCLKCSHIALRCISPYRGKLTGYRLHFIPVVNSHFQMWSRNSNENGQINIFRQPFVSAHVQGADIISQQREYREKDFNNGGQQCEEPGISSFAITYSYFLVKANDVMVSEDREVYILHYECEVS